jgi:hypothetical protein
MMKLPVKQTQVTPIVEGYGGWALRMEIVPIESAYPGFGELVVSVIFINQGTQYMVVNVLSIYFSPRHLVPVLVPAEHTDTCFDHTIIFSIRRTKGSPYQ